MMVLQTGRDWQVDRPNWQTMADRQSWQLSRRSQEGTLLNGASPSHPGLHSFPNLEYSVTGLCSSPLAPRVTKRRSFGNACKICFSMAKRR